MKAIAIFPTEREVRLIDHPVSSLATPTDVRVKILEVGVCGTDREIARFDYGTPPLESPYLVLGHESLGEVVETGNAVDRVQPGDLVVTMVRRPCGQGECPACAVGRPDFCLTGQFTERGINGRHGFMTEEIVDDQRFLVVVPKDLRSVGVLLEPLTIAEKAMLEIGDVQDRLPWLKTGQARAAAPPAQKAVVLGAGPVGLLGAMALLVRGFQTWVYSREPSNDPKAKWVEEIGAKYVSATDVPLAGLRETVGNIDLIYEATGASQLAFSAMEILGTNGIFILTGVPGRKGPIQLDADLIMRNLVLKNQLVYGTVNAGRDAFEAGVTDLGTFQRRWPGSLEALITSRPSPDEYRELLLGPSTGIKRVVSFAGKI